MHATSGATGARTSTPPAGRGRAALRSSTTRSTASSSGRRPPIPTTGSRAPTRWRRSSSACCARWWRQHRDADPGASTCFTGESATAPTSTLAGAACRSRSSVPTIPGAAVVVTLGAMEPEAVVEALGELARARRRGRAAACPRAHRPGPARRGEPSCSTRWTRRCAVPGNQAGLAGRRGTGAGGPGRGRQTSAPASWIEVYRHLPGELAPKLALAYAAEAAGDHAVAAAWYDIVSSVDPGLHPAAFGLARARSAMDDRTGRHRGLRADPATAPAPTRRPRSRRSTSCSTDDGAGADLADVRRAAAIVDGPVARRASSDRLTADVLEAAHDALSRNGTRHRSRDAGPRPPLHRPRPAAGPRSRLPGCRPPRSAPTAERIALVDRPTGSGPGRGGESGR